MESPGYGCSCKSNSRRLSACLSTGRKIEAGVAGIIIGTI